VRAREPDTSAYVDRDGVRVYYEVHGSGPDPIVFSPADSIVDSRMWKGQVAYLARHHRVVVIDGRGNGRSDRPTEPERYTDLTFVGDLIAVMDEVGIPEAVVVGLCDSAWYALLAAARHPDRIAGVVAIGPSGNEGTPRPDRGIDSEANWTADLTDPQGSATRRSSGPTGRPSRGGSSRRSPTTPTARRSSRTRSTGPTGPPVS
jgi:pimeloyl-ACP methyl ester carboxylesterase